MSYNTKNYTEQGGCKTVIGGELEFKEGARVTGFPSAANQPASGAGTVALLRDDFNALLVKLKEAGIVTPDAWAFTARTAPGLSGKGKRNNDKASVAIDGTVITVTADVDNLEEYDSNPEQGTHKWIGLGIGTGLASLTLMKYNGYPATNADVNEAVATGLDQPGEFILWLKADEAVVTPKTFKVDADGYAETEITVRVVKPEADQ